MRAHTTRGALCVLAWSMLTSCDDKAKPSGQQDTGSPDAATTPERSRDAEADASVDEADASSDGDASDPGMGMDATVSSDDGGSTAMMIGAAGGVVRAMDGAVTIDIPAGALSSMTMITVGPALTAPAGAIGTAIEIEPAGTKFMKPVTIGFELPPAMLASTDLGELTVGTLVGGSWRPAPVVFAVQGTGELRALSNHFSIWGIIPRGKDPCKVDLTCSQQCCKGSHTGDKLSTTCLSTGLYEYDDCYAECTGSASVMNYSTGCLRSCCTEHGGDPSPAGACVLRDHDNLALALACSYDCFGTDDPVTVCFGDALESDPHDHSWCTSCEGCGGGCGTASCSAAGNACKICILECHASEKCGDDIDNDCNGLVDDGCAGRECTRSSYCPAGSACQGSYCMPCSPCDEGSCETGSTCVLYGNGCRQCRTCRSTESCGNDIDDNCDGQVDEGCIACTRTAQCPTGQRCEDRLCTPCAACRAQECGDGESCVQVGNGCRACGVCDAQETCGNDVDDNCNGVIDEGCAALHCYRSSQCPVGHACRDDEFCRPCTSTDGCTIAGAPCTLPDTEPGRCAAVGNGCFACGPLCEPDAREICGDDYDNDCNNVIDDGCVPCTSAVPSTCPAGMHCDF